MNTDQNKLNACGCCEGIAWLTPAEIVNTPGLQSLVYRVGVHASFKESMLRGLSASPALRRLTTREGDDATIALIDAWAVVLDILSFYQERYVQEGFLRTSKERLSLFELARHIGYRPKPGVAAETWLSFFLDESPGAPAEVAIPAGTKVQSIPGQGERPQLFETVEEIRAKARWNEIRPNRYQKQSLNRGSTSIYLQGTDTQLLPGDKIFIDGEDDVSPVPLQVIRTVHSVETDNQENCTKITFVDQEIGDSERTLTKATVYVFRQRAALFGHNAPDPRIFNCEDLSNPFSDEVIAGENEWNITHVINSLEKTIYLDAVYPKILKNSWIALTEFEEEIIACFFQIKEVGTTAIKKFSLATKATKIILDKEDCLNYFKDLRKVVIFAQSEELPLAKAPISTAIYGKNIQLEQAQNEVQIGQPLIISGELVTHLQQPETSTLSLVFYPISGELESDLEAGEVLELMEVPPQIEETLIRWFVKRSGQEGYVIDRGCELVPYEIEDIANTSEIPTSLNQSKIVSELVTIEALNEEADEVTLSEPLKHVYLRHTVTINANVALATHGETKTEILGSGDGAKVFQRFKLKQKPLTYISATSPSGSESTLEVRVNDIKWKEVPAFYGRTAEDRDYIIRAEEDGSVYVQFGDGITGARLPTGIENVKATYRVGIGLEGQADAGQLSLLMTPQLGLKSVSNPLPADGADKPESLKDIRRNAPQTVRTLDRAVSLKDFEDFANAFAGIGKARADLLWKGVERAVFITIAAADQGPVDEDLIERLIDAINAARHDNYPVMVRSFEPRSFNVIARILTNPDYLEEKVIAQVKEALQQAFCFEARAFGQDVAPSEVVAAMQAVEGVIAVDLEELDGRDPFSEEHFRLRANIAEWTGTDPLPAELLLIDPENIEISLMNDENQ